MATNNKVIYGEMDIVSNGEGNYAIMVQDGPVGYIFPITSPSTSMSMGVMLTLISLRDEERQKYIDLLIKLGVLAEGATADDILTPSTEEDPIHVGESD